MVQKLSQTQAPFFEEIQRYAKQPLLPFHTPGHKAGLGWAAEWREVAGLAGLDLTEIPGLDWAGALQRAEALAAQFYRADQSFFLVQGASQGIHAAILGAFEPGTTVLVGRNCHSSVIHGLILADIHPVYLAAETLPEWGIASGVSLGTLAQAIEANPAAKGVILTNPSYQGIAFPTTTLRKIIGDRILVVDEAHGGHFGWAHYPECDAWDVADLWVQGTHKLFGSLTQTGMLHLRQGRIDPARLRRHLELISTTSPSYILLASLDVSRRFLALEGAELFRNKLPNIFGLKDKLARIPGIAVLEAAMVPEPLARVDPWKICLSFAALGLSGYQAEAMLRHEFGIQAEYADLRQVTFFLAPWQPETALQRLLSAISIISQRRGPGVPEVIPALPIPRLVNRPRQAALGRQHEITLQKAVGCVAAAVIAPYPPGIALVGPGEVIGLHEVEYIQLLIGQGGFVKGVTSEGNVLISDE